MHNFTTEIFFLVQNFFVDISVKIIFLRIMEQQVRASVNEGVPVLAFTLVGDQMRVLGSRNCVEQFKEDSLAMSKMEKILKGNWILKDSG